MIKLNPSKHAGTLLLLLIMHITISMLIPVACPEENLPYPGGWAITYGSTWNMTEDEITCAEQVCDHMLFNFNGTHYNATDAYGNLTQVSNVLNWAYVMEHCSHRVALFHHGHGGKLGIHYDYFDNDGNAQEDLIWDNATYQKTSLGKHIFAFIWACRQGDEVGYMSNTSGAVGMPHAWHHTTNLSDDGYADPDDGQYCFIGFENMSIPLNDTICGFDNTTAKCRDFVMYFDYYALNQNYSINSALDQASLDLLHMQFNETELYTGYEAYWPGPYPEKGYYPGKMRVYGNGDIHINQHKFTVLVEDQNSTEVEDADVYIDLFANIASINYSTWVTGGRHTVCVNDFWSSDPTGWRYSFMNYTYDSTTDEQNPTNLTFSSDRTITAHFCMWYCPGDADGNGVVDIYDGVLITSCYGSSRGDYTEWNSICDLDADWDVDVFDVVIYSSNYGKEYEKPDI